MYPFKCKEQVKKIQMLIGFIVDFCCSYTVIQYHSVQFQYKILIENKD